MAYGDNWIRYPRAAVHNLGRSLSTTALAHDILCLHTMVGTLNGSLSWSSRVGGTYWHYGLDSHGRIVQCQDLRYRSAANLNGNWHVIPLETADRDEGTWPNEWQPRPWTQAQLDEIVRWCAWHCDRFDIPPVLIPDTRPGRRGIAYHRQGIDPWRVSGGELWSRSTGKTCPTDPRIGQLTTIVIPRVRAALQPPPPPPPPVVFPEGEPMFMFEGPGDGQSPVFVPDPGNKDASILIGNPATLLAVVSAHSNAKPPASLPFIKLPSTGAYDAFVAKYGPVPNP